MTRRSQTHCVLKNKKTGGASMTMRRRGAMTAL